jgi:hypothetical protein
MHKPRGGKLGSLIIQVLVTRLSKFELSLHIAAATFHKLLLSVRSVSYSDCLTGHRVQVD